MICHNLKTVQSYFVQPKIQLYPHIVHIMFTIHQSYITKLTTVKKDAKKKSHTSSELSIIIGYLFRGWLTDHSPLHKRGTGTESSSREREWCGKSLCICIYAYSRCADNLREHRHYREIMVMTWKDKQIGQPDPVSYIFY